MSDHPYISIILPAYNEAKRLPATLERLREFLGDLGRSFEVLIIVERSTDGTLEIATRWAEEQAHFQAVDNLVHRGKGYAVRSGMLRARGEVLIYMDADLSVPLGEVRFFLREFERDEAVDGLFGDRQHEGSRITRKQTWLRRRMGQTFNWLLQCYGLSPHLDTQCGFKAFRRAAGRAIFAEQKLDGFAFDVEVLLLAERLGYKVRGLPVEWRNSPESKVRIFRDSLRMIGDLWRIRRRLAREFPKKK